METRCGKVGMEGAVKACNGVDKEQEVGRLVRGLWVGVCRCEGQVGILARRAYHVAKGRLLERLG